VEEESSDGHDLDDIVESQRSSDDHRYSLGKKTIKTPGAIDRPEFNKKVSLIH